ncbi:MAG: dihydrolipoamide acetyltransferase family protein [Candidatus Krumholzibacteria bacterium]|jgi:pyruvate dehydrogenase E2 component (dihydrolipoamide acetyltransferase)|nr:dihydrolipoamide acetyltransferase family protein [Candidatus Krumholzibacteria bacterium]
MFEFKLPDLGEGIAEGEILKWHVASGQAIAEDAPLLDVETDKAAVTIPTPRGGRVALLHGKAGDVVNVGAVVAVIDDGLAEEAAPAAARDAAVPPASAAARDATPAAAQPTPAPVVPPDRRRPVPAAPATRRLARELGADIDQVPSSGPAGRVTPDDVRRFHTGDRAAMPPGHVAAKAIRDDQAFAEFAAHAAATIPFLELEPLPDFSRDGPVEIEPLRSIRRKVARKMVTSMALVPHVAHMDDADVTEWEEFRKRQKEARRDDPGIGNLTILSFVIKAVTAGLRAAPAFNASLDPFKEEIVYKKYYNIGFAADTGRGLVVPVIRDTDRKSIREISAEIAAKAALAREGKLPAEDMRGGTFTITNVGPLGGTAMLPTINYPEAAILGMGKVQEKPVVRNGQIVIRKILPLTLAFDHRLADGADAARFVGELIKQLADPNLLLLEA